MPLSRTSRSRLLELNLSKKDILALDPHLFSAEEKKAFIELLYGAPQEVSWKQDLASAAYNTRRWNCLLSADPNRGEPYRVGHNELALRARFTPPKKVGHAVSDFADWIFRLYVPEKDHGSLLRGQQLEREVAVRRIPAPSHSRWKLVFNGMVDNDSEALPITPLTINGIPLRGKPDLVFREKGTKRVLIVEIKTSEAAIPSNGWPNIRAQLWAYSKIDAWRDADDVLLVGEIWGFANGLRLRQAIHWRKSDQMFEGENSELFALYRSHCEANTGSRNALGT